jgi:hypothetical protein
MQIFVLALLASVKILPGRCYRALSIETLPFW